MLSECHYSVTVSGSGIYAVIYYAGHGFELDGENYLLPVDAMSPDPNESIRAQEFLQEMQSCDTLLNLMFLDCCRTRCGILRFYIDFVICRNPVPILVFPIED